MNIKDKHITILGAVRSGVAAAKLVKEVGGIPFVSDMASYESLKESYDMLTGYGIDYEAGQHSTKVYDCDMIVTSPGIPSSAKVLVEAVNRGIEIISELELASAFCKGDVIAITGSNGKTTTTMLTAHVFNACGIKTHLAGNIGFAFSEVVLNVNPGEVVALEVSSFQLDYIKNFKPKVSAILNVTPDHLDRYENSFDKYFDAKLRIFENQSAGDCLVLNYDDPRLFGTKAIVGKFGFSLKEKVNRGSYYENGELIYNDGVNSEVICSYKDLSIKGEHNIANAMAVIAFARIFGLKTELIKKALGTFAGVEHRLELVRELNGVEYINDSKATNIDSVWYALRSFEKPLYLILGGKDKGNDYSRIVELVKEHVRKIYAIGSSAPKVYDNFSEVVEVEIIESLEACVLKASKEADEGTVVLLSPACASFDMFNNYEHRGQVFKKAVMELSE